MAVALRGSAGNSSYGAVDAQDVENPSAQGGRSAESRIKDAEVIFGREYLVHVACELDRCYKVVAWFWTAYSWVCAVLTTTMLTLNAGIMAAKVLGWRETTLAYLACACAIIKGLELTFTLSHKRELAAKGTARIKMLDTEVQKLIVLYDSQTAGAMCGRRVTKSLNEEIARFAAQYSKSLSLVSEFVPPRGAPGPASGGPPKASQAQTVENQQDQQLHPQPASSGGPPKASQAQTVENQQDQQLHRQPAEAQAFGFDGAYLEHCARELDRTYQQSASSYSAYKGLCAALTITTLSLNAGTMGADAFGLHEVALAAFAAINSIIKGIELHFKLEHKLQTLSKGVAWIKKLDTKVQTLLALYDSQVPGKSDTKLQLEISKFAIDYDHGMDSLSEFVAVRNVRGKRDASNG